MNNEINRLFEISHFTIHLYSHNEKYDFSVCRRNQDGICLVECGSCTFIFENTEFTLKPGDLIFLPKNISYKLCCRGELIQYYTLNFLFVTKPFFRDPPDITISEASEYVMSEIPFVFSDAAIQLSVKCIYDDYMIGTELGIINAIADFYRLFGRLKHTINKERIGNVRVKAAIDLIESSPIREFSPRELAGECALSLSRFYTLFEAETGMSPTRYRNHIRVGIAKTLLLTRRYSVEEIGEMLGFMSTDYFSRVFKEIAGKSPKKYQLST